MSAYSSPAPATSPAPANENQSAVFIKPPPLTILVRDQYEGETNFLLRPTTKFKKVKDKWCQRQGVDVLSVRFSFNGRRINDHETLEDLEIEDNDVVDVHLEQAGGGA